MSHSPLIIETVIPLPVDRTFSYRVPAALRDAVAFGMRVLVPFGKRRVTAYVVGTREEKQGEELKEVIELLDAEPLFTERECAFFRWTADYYLHPLGEVIKVALPAGINMESRKGDDGEYLAGGRSVLTEPFYRALPEIDSLPRLGEKAAELFEWIAHEGEVPLSRIRERFSAPYPQLRRLTDLGLIASEEREVYRDPFREEVFGRDEPLTLNGHQSAALSRLAERIASAAFAPFLLHGITGSGKTEVYLQAIALVLERGMRALVLVPEIALTPQVVKRFRRRFSQGIAVLHSGLSPGERFDEWRRIRRGEVEIVIGARSAIFAPLEKIGIIVVDEEHESSYKQSEGLRYNARDLALVRGKMEGAAVLLASATPLVTSVYAAREGRLTLLELPVRVRDLPLPQIRLIDRRGKKGTLLLPEMVQALRENLAAGGQSLLFLNRRGFATFVICEECGHVLKCPNCSVTLTYHKRRGRHFCHYCEHSIPAPSTCPGCSGGNMILLGQGTERIEEEVRALFPEARIERMDRDTTTGRNSHARILKGLEEGTTDILVGTQMIAKGHDIPGVTLVGVVSADESINFPDFRSAERTFQLLTQVTGRAGRGDLPGRVLIQTLEPEHYALERALAHDFEGFYQDELETRQETGFPPFSHLAAIWLSAVSEKGVDGEAIAAAELLGRLRRSLSARVEILGPAAPPLAMVRGRHRRHILLKSPRRPQLHHLLEEFRRHFRPAATVRLHLDVDPVDML